MYNDLSGGRPCRVHFAELPRFIGPVLPHQGPTHLWNRGFEGVLQQLHAPKSRFLPNRFRGYVRPHRHIILVALACEVVAVIVQLLLPWPMKLVIDHVLDAAELPSVLQPLAGLGPIGLAVVAGAAGALLSLIDSLMTYAASLSSARAGEYIARDMRFAMMKHLLSLGPEFHEHYDTGELSNRLGSDVSRVQSNVLLLATGILPDCALLLGMLTVVTLIDHRLAIVIVLVVPPLAMLTRLRRRQTRDAQAEVRRASGRLDSTTIESLRHLRLAQMFTQEHRVRGVYATVNDDLVAAELDGNRVDARFRPPTDLIMSIGAMVVIVFGVTQIRSGRLTTGTLLVVLSYLGNVYGPIRRLAGIAAASARASVSGDRIAELLEARPIVHQGPLAIPVRFKHAIRFDNVEARYPNGFVALSDINLSIHPGERICVVGTTGAGKSTLLSLIPRLIDPSAGAISVDNVHLGAIDLRSWRAQIAIVPQDAELFRGSIAENIAFGYKGASWDDMVTAAKLAYVDEFVAGLPDGYDSVVGTDGTRLSGGQRRRVVLARALIRRAPILLLDEPTSGLDARSEEIVIESIRRASIGRTCVTVTHRIDLACEYDRVVVVERGRVVESGRPSDLILAGGHFAELRATQNGSRGESLSQRERR
jgi:ATP-binding cassette, subfamily B, bacterial